MNIAVKLTKWWEVYMIKMSFTSMTKWDAYLWYCEVWFTVFPALVCQIFQHVLLHWFNNFCPTLLQDNTMTHHTSHITSHNDTPHITSHNDTFHITHNDTSHTPHDISQWHIPHITSHLTSHITSHNDTSHMTSDLTMTHQISQWQITHLTSHLTTQPNSSHKVALGQSLSMKILIAVAFYMNATVTN